jgi:hypothetical protein
VSPEWHSLVVPQDWPGPLPAGIWHWPALQLCPAGQAWAVVTQAPAVQVLVARLLPSVQAVPQSLPSAAGSQAEPSARHFPLVQGPLQAAAAQQIPPTQPRPARHWPLLPPQASPGPRATGSQAPVLGLQLLPAPHLTGEHFHPVAASHTLQPPAQD